MLRVDEVGAATRVGDLAHVDQAGQFAFLHVDGADLVGLVGRDHEVALGAVEAAVVEELGNRDFLDRDGVDVGVVDHQRLGTPGHPRSCRGWP